MTTCAWCGCGVDVPDQWWWELKYECNPITRDMVSFRETICQRCGDGSGLRRVGGTYTTFEKCIGHPHIKRGKGNGRNNKRN
jgi:hypothetical protein